MRVNAIPRQCPLRPASGLHLRTRACMGDLNRGKELFTKRVEYPLPQKTGTKDYIFYLVSAGDGYRDAGSKFFATFYKNHVKHDVHTLEDLIDTLAAEVDRG